MITYEYLIDTQDYDGDHYLGIERTGDLQYLPVKVYLPDAPGNYPVIVFSHGAYGSYNGVADFAETWTEAGYIVVAPTHADSMVAGTGLAYDVDDVLNFASGGYTDGGAGQDEQTFRADDVSLAINFMQTFSNEDLPEPDGSGEPTGSSTGYGMDTTKAVVAVGHSYGSNTVSALGGAALRDYTPEGVGDGDYYQVTNDEIDAVIALSGNGIDSRPFFDEDSWNGTEGEMAVPYLRVSGSEDIPETNDVTDRFMPFFLTEEYGSYAAFGVNIDGATHAQLHKMDGDEDGTVSGDELAMWDDIVTSTTGFINSVVFGLTGSGAEIGLQDLQALDLGEGTEFDLSGGSETKSLGSGDDLYFGLDGADTLNGNSDNDTLYGGEGNDSLSGGLDDDRLVGGFGDDTMVGGSGNDEYFVDSAGDVVSEVSPGDGTDTVQSSVSYTLGSYVENLTLLKNDTTNINGTGNGLDNVINGNSSANVLIGAGGADSIFGSGGDDTIDGGDGADTLQGSVGQDSLTGGANDDVFYYFDYRESQILSNQRDLIVDFGDSGDDVIDLSTLDANLDGGTADDTFTYIGSSSFTDVGQLRVIDFGSSVLVMANLTGDTTADMVIELQNTSLGSMSAGDFIL